MAERSPSYATQLGAVLRRGDPEALRTFLIENARRFGDEHQVADVDSKSYEEMRELLHRMTLARPDLKDLHRQSRAWLEQHGVAADSGD